MIFLILIFFLAILFLLNFEKIAKKINLYDYPDKVRKFQKKKVSVIGGFIFIIFFNLFIIFNYQKLIDFNHFPNLLVLESFREIFLFQFVIISVFLIGLYDDRYNLRAINKASLLIVLISVFVFFEADSQITEIRITLLDEKIILGNSAIMFTVLCFFSLIVSLNMFDGFNGQSFINFFLIAIYILIKGYFNEIIYLLLFLLLIFGYLNFKNKVYLGDNGIHFLGFLFSFLIIKTYNLNSSINAEEIVIILLIPIIDSTRLFFVRIYRGQNPFHPDAEHIHHLISKRYGSKYVIPILFFLLSTPYFLIFANINYFIILLLQILMYLFFLINLKKIKKNK
jgi:UDP-GlcNAc:undecaprenyl-phosphate/decaprenyl-phosphate GlcNAc-1-phosphate transferase